jgi:hypothetical protein
LSRSCAEILADSEPSFIEALSGRSQMRLKTSAAGSLPEASRLMATSSHMQTDLK